MDFPPPSLSLSCASSPNTDYSAPDFVDSHYKLTSSACNTSCEMDYDMESDGMPSMEGSTPEDWTDPMMLQSSASTGMPGMLSSPYVNYDPVLPPSYGNHDLYTPTINTMTPNPHHFPKSLSHTSHPGGRQSDSPPPRIKEEPLGDYPMDPIRYPSPYTNEAVSGGIRYYSPPDSVDSWTKPEIYLVDPIGPPPPEFVAKQPSNSKKSQKPSRPHTRDHREYTKPENANYQCKQCGKYFSRSYNYKAHLETHLENREHPFPCTVGDCNRRFVRKTDLQRHHQSVHMKEKNHRCDYCSRMFARKDTLRRHMEDGCPRRFDIGTLDVRAEDYASNFETRHSSDLQHSSTQLAPMADTQLRNVPPTLSDPFTSLARQRY